MIVMPANSTGWFWHSLARETGRIGHLYSPRAQRGPWPWFPYALDNGSFSCWDQETNTLDDAKWATAEGHWRRLLFWAGAAPIRPRWAIVPDVPGNAERTLERWSKFAADVPFQPALAVQDGMEPGDVRRLAVQPAVICIGGTTDWKWATVEKWAGAFPRVHLLRCNAPTKLSDLEAMGIESTDGTGWCRGNRRQTEGLETWARSKAVPISSPLWPHVCRAPRVPQQELFA